MSGNAELHQGAAVVVLNQKQEILLQKREDFRLWDLPGGLVEPGEDFEAAAIREAYEETGLIVALDALVCIYHYPQRNAAVHIYRAHATGGALLRRTSETVDAGWFAKEQLPHRMNMFVRDAIQDTFLFAGKPLEIIKEMSPALVVLRGIALGIRNVRNRYFRKVHRKSC